jgi:hypothetical protein
VKRVLQSPTALVTLLVTVIWVFGYAVGADWWPIAISVGYAVGIPISSVFLEGELPDGEESDSASDGSMNERRTDRSTYETGADETATGGASTADALETLRERYAAGDLSETQFETKLEQLLETETVEDASAYVGGDETDGGSEAVGRELTRETEQE